jgi:hypothetical protein
VDSALSPTSENPVQNKVITTELNKKANSSSLATVATSGSYNDLSNKPTIDSALSTSSTNAVQNKVVTTALNSKADTSSLSTVATSGSYNDLSNKPTIPTVNNATLTIQKNGTTVKTFTANASSNVTANITVPTSTSELTNDSGFIDEIPVASAGTLGGIKVGNNLSIDASGVLSADAQSITVDSALSTSSQNPVQNKVITTALNGKNKTIWTAYNLSPAANTPASWKTLLGGEGIYWTWYNTANKFTNQPATYGLLRTVIGASDVRQDFYVQSGGEHYFRTGNGTGWYGLSGNVGNFRYLGNNVDTALSTTSNNPVRNSVITEKINDVDAKPNSYWGTSSTAAATAAKVVTVSSDQNFKLVPGAMVTFKAPNTNTAQNPTINVNNTGAKPVWYNSAVVTTSNLNKAGQINRPATYVYDGTNWVWASWSLDDNITYSTMSVSEGTTGTATTARTVRADYLKQIIQHYNPTVNDATLTIQKNGTNVQTFTANSATNKTANIQVPNLRTSNTDPGEGSALAADTFLGIYDIAPEDVDGARLVDGSVTAEKIDWSTITTGRTAALRIATGGSTTTITIPTQANTDYKVFLEHENGAEYWNNISWRVSARTTTSFTISFYNTGAGASPNNTFSWMIVPSA